MKSYNHSIGGERCYVRYLEHDEDADVFFRWLSGQRVIAVDTETTGLDIYSPGHRVRLVQFGNTREAFVLEREQFGQSIIHALRQLPFAVMHNAAYDLAVLDRHGLSRMEDLAPRTFDTGILAHLVDPRGKDEGGLGLRLKDLAVHYVAADADDGEKALTQVFRQEYGATKAQGWADVDIDHPEYVRYAGNDVLLTMRLFNTLRPLVKERGLGDLSQFEHALQAVTTRLSRRGLLVDVPYTEGLVTELGKEAERYRMVAAGWGVENVNSTKQVAAALMERGWKPTEYTKTGPKVDKGVLLPLAGLTPDWQPIDGAEVNALADAVLRVKRAEKWSTAYAQRFLTERDPYNRIHPSIHSLQARTARMSISGPPLQQLPSGDWRIRRAVVADLGNVFFSVDFSQVEMRVLAGLSGDQVMTDAIKSGVDLHSFTAERMYGDDFTKAQRKLAKIAGFGKVYGGSAATLSRQTGAPEAEVAHALRAYDQTFRGIKRYSKRLTERIEFGTPEVITPIGRRLPVDRHRAYSATNYLVQSTARDLLAQSLMACVAAGLEQFLNLPIHDELLGQAPEADAKDAAESIRELMTGEFMGVPIVADIDLGGRSWGSLYGATE